MKKIISFFIVSLFLVGITNAQINENEITTPDQTTYYMKVKVPEYFQLLFAKDKIVKRLEFLEKRRMEYEKLGLKFNETTKDKQERILVHLRKLESNRLEHQKIIDAQFKYLDVDRKLFVLQQLQKHHDRLIEVQQKLPEPAQQRIVVAIESSSKSIKRFNEEVANIQIFEKMEKGKNVK